MIKHILYNAYTKVPLHKRKSIIDFLHENSLNEAVTKNAISEAIDYAVKEIPSFGGFVLVANNEHEILGVTVVNKTGLNGGNPKHRIVYMAVHETYRLNGVATKLIQDAIKYSGGDISLRVEKGNEAIQLYESLGFQTQFVEMRLSSPTNLKNTQTASLS